MQLGVFILSVLKFQLLLQQCSLYIFLLYSKQHIIMINSKSQHWTWFWASTIQPVAPCFLYYFLLIFYRILTGHFLDVVSLSKLLNYLVAFNSYLCIKLTEEINWETILLRSWEFVSWTRDFPLLRNPMDHDNVHDNMHWELSCIQSISFRFSTCNFVCIYYVTYAGYMFYPSHHTWFDQPP